MAWNEAVVTNDGLELLAKCVLGESVEITSAAGLMLSHKHISETTILDLIEYAVLC